MRSVGFTLLVLMVISHPLAAQGGGAGGTGSDTLAAQDLLPAKVVQEVVAVFNAAATTRFRGDSRVEAGATINGDVAVLGGQLTVAGHVRGRVIAINADVVLTPNARIDEDILVVGGTVGRRENGRVRGGIRSLETRMILTESADTLVADSRYTDEGKWWSGLQLDTERNRSRITFRGETYNRVEGLPIHVGPTFRRNGPIFRTTLDALGIIRTADRIRWDSENIGHKVDFSMRLNREKGFGLNASLFDVVEPIESWQFSDHEAGLATFLLHRDFRDHYARHGGSVGVTLFRGYERELEIGYSHERWRSRDARDTWTLWRDSDPWRPNPEVNDGRMHVLSATLRVDTRNSETNPWSGWHVAATAERGSGELGAPGIAAPSERTSYSRMLVDVRRYNRISARGQLNARLVYGGRLGDEQLPLQKRFSVGGPGSLPGFDFRRTHGGTDVGMCSSGDLLPSRPALCERIALLQLEYRGDIGIDLFGSGDRDDPDWREVGRHPGAQWVIFTDAGRGWLVGDADAADAEGLSYPGSTVLPKLGTFRTDVGIGLDMGIVGVFVARAVSQSDVPANFFVRLRHRF